MAPDDEARATARRIVDEVLASRAGTQQTGRAQADATPDTPTREPTPRPRTGSDDAAGRSPGEPATASQQAARRIVEEVLAARSAGDVAPASAPTATSRSRPYDPGPGHDRATSGPDDRVTAEGGDAQSPAGVARRIVAEVLAGSADEGASPAAQDVGDAAMAQPEPTTQVLRVRIDDPHARAALRRPTTPPPPRPEPDPTSDHLPAPVHDAEPADTAPDGPPPVPPDVARNRARAAHTAVEPTPPDELEHVVDLDAFELDAVAPVTDGFDADGSAAGGSAAGGSAADGLDADGSAAGGSAAGGSAADGLDAAGLDAVGPDDPVDGHRQLDDPGEDDPWADDPWNDDAWPLVPEAEVPDAVGHRQDPGDGPRPTMPHGHDTPDTRGDGAGGEVTERRRSSVPAQLSAEPVDEPLFATQTAVAGSRAGAVATPPGVHGRDPTLDAFDGEPPGPEFEDAPAPQPHEHWDPPTVASARPRRAASSSAPRRTGRWLLTTIIAAVALAVLFPLAIRAVLDLVALS